MDELRIKFSNLKYGSHFSVIIVIEDRHNYRRVDYYNLWCEKYLRIIIKRIEIEITNMLINGTTVDKLVEIINKL